MLNLSGRLHLLLSCNYRVHLPSQMGCFHGEVCYVCNICASHQVVSYSCSVIYSGQNVASSICEKVTHTRTRAHVRAGPSICLLSCFQMFCSKLVGCIHVLISYLVHTTFVYHSLGFFLYHIYHVFQSPVCAVWSF